ncbi:hypothetical protein QJS66_03110 [Kocuria rhizophila]|nr:hypothetical protein QJS66_03110 [Kocuria rhizophila]
MMVNGGRAAGCVVDLGMYRDVLKAVVAALIAVAVHRASPHGRRGSEWTVSHTTAQHESCPARDVTVTMEGPRGPVTILDRVTCSHRAAHRRRRLDQLHSPPLLRLFNTLVTPSSGAVRTHGVRPVASPRTPGPGSGTYHGPASQILMPSPVEGVGLCLRRPVRDRAETRGRQCSGCGAWAWRTARTTRCSTSRAVSASSWPWPRCSP